MKTTSIGVENLCVPCHASCRYCLLSSCKRATGIEYERGKAFSSRLREEMMAVRPDLRFFYYIGYCMDTPHLLDYIRFCREIGSPSADFLQFNGLRMRSERDTIDLIESIHGEGIREIDLTFYGMQKYHDHFAGREGDFGFLLQILSAANQVGQAVGVSFPLTKENIAQADALLALLSRYEISRFSVFLPHGKGRGRLLEGQRITKADFEFLSQEIKRNFSKVEHKTEREWLAENHWPQAENRVLTLCLEPDNIDRLEIMSAEEILRSLEQLDDASYEKIPPMNDLADLYGDSDGEELFRLRDLQLKWQQMYLREHPEIHDMNDETHHFSVRL